MSVGDDVQHAEETDGRRLRRARNRAAAVQALLDLYREGRYDPSAAEIAQRAGLSPRSLFRYFDDVDDLVHEAVESRAETLRPVLERRVDPGLDISARIGQFVDLRLDLFEVVGGAGRVARLREPFQPEIKASLTLLRRVLRRQTEATFGDRLGPPGSPERLDLVTAVDMLCSYESVDLMVQDQGFDRPQCRAVLVRSLTLLLGA